MCVYIYIHTYIYIYTYIHTYIYTHKSLAARLANFERGRSVLNSIDIFSYRCCS